MVLVVETPSAPGDQLEQLRPPHTEAPNLYKQSELGWIPNDWQIHTLADIADTLIDGPFGSNLKSEHYVEEPGVRVVRLQNIQDGCYNDSDRAFISQRHANKLSRHTVDSGDVLIAALGEDNNPVGRACCYPVALPPAINKADCFRLRCNSSYASNIYVMFYLNTFNTGRQVARFEQGVTRRRINLGNSRKIKVPLPDMEEQLKIFAILNSNLSLIEKNKCSLNKLVLLKQALMRDLLTGKVQVKAEIPEETVHACNLR